MAEQSVQESVVEGLEVHVSLSAAVGSSSFSPSPPDMIEKIFDWMESVDWEEWPQVIESLSNWLSSVSFSSDLDIDIKDKG